MSYYYLSYHDSDLDFVEQVFLPQFQDELFAPIHDRYQFENDPQFTKGISSAISRSYGVIVIVSAESMKCEDVKYEWGYAHYIEKPLIPVMIETPEMISPQGKLQIVYPVHEKLARVHWYNFSDAKSYEWGALKHAMVTIATEFSGVKTTVTMPILRD